MTSWRLARERATSRRTGQRVAYPSAAPSCSRAACSAASRPSSAGGAGACWGFGTLARSGAGGWLRRASPGAHARDTPGCSWHLPWGLPTASWRGPGPDSESRTDWAMICQCQVQMQLSGAKCKRSRRTEWGQTGRNAMTPDGRGLRPFTSYNGVSAGELAGARWRKSARSSAQGKLCRARPAAGCRRRRPELPGSRGPGAGVHRRRARGLPRRRQGRRLRRPAPPTAPRGRSGLTGDPGPVEAILGVHRRPVGRGVGDGRSSVGRLAAALPGSARAAPRSGRAPRRARRWSP